MTVEAFFCEWEEKHEVNGEIVSGCITYPVTITTEHSTSSYGKPVVLIDGEPHGCEEMPPGELQIPVDMYENLAPKLERNGYIVCSRAVDESWMRRWENGIEFDDRHWHPQARLVFF